MTERRLIEDYLPVEAVSSEAASEKIGGREGHISTFHLWWARRPLAAARAAVYASLVPAPKEVDFDALSGFFKALCRWGGPQAPIQDAREAVLGAAGGRAPNVLDMFAGGGAIPLEATRLGCETTALELNPVAHLIELCALDYPQRLPGLARDVEQWGSRLVERAKQEIGWMYPDVVDEGPVQPTLDSTGTRSRRIPIAYLWTRTVRCPNPAEQPHHVPLVRQTWLAKKPGRFVALRLVPDRTEMRVSFEAVEAATPEALGFDPAGFSKRGSTTCVLCGASVDLGYVKQEGKGGRLGVEPMAVALVTPGVRGKTYLGSRVAAALVPDEERLARMLAELGDHGLLPPDEPICASDTLNFKVPLYGLTKFRDLFTQRQLVMLLTLCRLARDSYDEMIDSGLDTERAKAIATYFGLLIDRVADRSSTICRWDNSPSYEGTTNTFGRQALPMTWDFSESNPFGGASGDLGGQLNYIVKAIEHCERSGAPVRVLRGSATKLPFKDAEFDAVITDPPYYDNISYADLSDFFYVWLKRSVGRLYPEHLNSELTPKRSEIIASPYRQGSKDEAKIAYETMMRDSFAEARRVLKPEGIMVCVYAHQTTAGWSTLIEAVRQAGFVVVEAWPLNTEMGTRGVARGAAALASSIFLVARPRTEQRSGDWAHEVRPELGRIVSERVAQLPELGVTGTDLVIAAVGAGMRAYTRFARVEKPNGEELAPDEYLEEVEREVAEAVLARIFQTDRRGLGRVDQQTQFYVMGRFEFGDALAPWDELNILARGTGVELSELTRAPKALVSFGEKRDQARLCDFRERGSADELGLDGARSTIDHLHRILWLAEAEPNRLKDYLAIARPDPERVRLVAHALARPGLDSAGSTSPEAEACERLLAVWRRLVEDNLFTQAASS